MTGPVLAVIDMQRYFFVENPNANERRLTEACNEIICTSREANVPTVFIETRYRADRRDWPAAFAANGQSWCSHLVNRSQLALGVEGLDIKPSDAVVAKTRFSAFYATNLDDVLRSYSCGHLYLIGYSADVCIRFTAVDAYNRGYAVTTIDEGIESFHEPKEAAIEYLQWLITSDCISKAEYKRRLQTFSVEIEN